MRMIVIGCKISYYLFGAFSTMDEISLKIEKPKTFCGIVGVYGAKNASSYIYYGLNALQHRGQEAAGIVTRERSGDKTFFNVHKNTGLVADVFKNDKILTSVLKGDAGIGHNRYSTTGSAESRKNVQPIVVNYREGKSCDRPQRQSYEFPQAAGRADGMRHSFSDDYRYRNHPAS